ncbi:MAG: DUF948 domain-containing protein [Actinomycetota bacterium]
MDTAWDIAKIFLLVAIAFSFWVACYLLYRAANGLAAIMKSTEELIDGVTKETVPLLSEVTTSVSHVNEELVRVDAITANVQTMTGNVSSLVGLFGTTLGTPLVKVAAFSYGIRKAIAGRNKADTASRVEKAMKEERRARRSARRSSRKVPR